MDVVEHAQLVEIAGRGTLGTQQLGFHQLVLNQPRAQAFRIDLLCNKLNQMTSVQIRQILHRVDECEISKFENELTSPE